VHPKDWKWFNPWIGPLQVDLMDTIFNAKLKTFVCPFPYPLAAGVHVNMVNWNCWQRVYASPPH
jgi:hypothetical protein